VFGKWKIHRSADHEVSVEISEKDGIRSLHLGSETVQSSMKLADPTELVLSYTRAMMAFLLFVPPHNAYLMIGLRRVAGQVRLSPPAVGAYHGGRVATAGDRGGSPVFPRAAGRRPF
jgi:spermidine synthase